MDWMTTLVPWILVIGFIGYVISLYNGLVALRNRFKNAFAQIDVQLVRRHDLIPNLVETAKRYMLHEESTLQAVVAARNQASAARGKAGQNPADGAAIQALAGAEAALGGALSRFNAVMESYPDLKASQIMGQLNEELASTENRVAFARQAFNDAVMSYNTEREQFPGNLIAGVFAFKEATLWEVSEPTQREAVKVQF